MGGVVKSLTGGRRKPAPAPRAPAPVAPTPAPDVPAAAPKQSGVVAGEGAQRKAALTARRGRSQLVSGRSNTATRGGIAIPR